jgi:hypothetical protein
MKRWMVIKWVCGFLASCASGQRITFDPPKDTSATGHGPIAVVDLRGNKDREFHAAGHPHCVRYYGDDFIAPSKTAYLRQVLEAKVRPGTRQTKFTISKLRLLSIATVVLRVRSR